MHDIKDSSPSKHEHSMTREASDTDDSPGNIHIRAPPPTPYPEPAIAHLLQQQQQQNRQREAASQAAMAHESTFPSPIPQPQTLLPPNLHKTVTIQTHPIHRPPPFPSPPTSTPPQHNQHPQPNPKTQTLHLRIYTPKPQGYTPANLPVYLYFHGGGFFTGTLASEDATCARLVSALYTRGTPIILISADYRHTPTVSYPDPYEDAWAAFCWLERRIAWLNGDPTRVVVGGEDAGAALAAWVAFFARTNVAGRSEVETRSARVVRVVGQVLCCPWMPFLDRGVAEGWGFEPFAGVEAWEVGFGVGDYWGLSDEEEGLVFESESEFEFEESEEEEEGDTGARRDVMSETGQEEEQAEEKEEEGGYGFYRDLLDVNRVEPGHHAIGMWSALGAMPRTYILTFADSLLKQRQLLFATLLLREKVDVHIKTLPGSGHDDDKDAGLLPVSHPWGPELVEALEWVLRPDATIPRASRHTAGA
ncbi:alpha/beta hydrolase [Aspergillus homomorphus CBS 101889]|uniref:Alpha/beta-hydrolase n=1 Tax=Aspergillus homomorphus (strain CBS 101889) TaxID=1450537 RepID=A0A395HYX8_ASPHC|nr:alpha/beta-hydrolase [Aspergillus homomorphus CBS 101889]RAL13131.1 alpha/beta-hydrolase [Aspergillus homomorphus CBS 101889]